MHYLIALLLVVTLWHYVAQRILIPSMRFELRCRLFEVRDRVRAMMIEGATGQEMRELTDLHDRCNAMINRVHLFSVEALQRYMKAAERDPEFQQRLEARTKAIEECSENTRSVHQELSLITLEAVHVNSLGWYLYAALPMFFRGRVRAFARHITSTSAVQLNRLLPQDRGNDAELAEIAA